MYGSVLTFLIAIFIAAHARAAPGRLAAWSPGELLNMALYPLIVWAGLRYQFRRHMSRALHDEGQAQALRIEFTALVQRYQVILLLPFALLLNATSYPALVAARWGGHSEALGGALGLLPFLGFLALLWWEAYPLQGVLYGCAGSRAQFVISHARMEFPLLLPWLLLMLGLDGLRWGSPRLFRAFEESVALQLVVLLAFLLLLSSILPVLIKLLWGCTPIPRGPLRDRLEAICGALRVKVSEILYWPLMEGRVLNAGIFGPVPRFRYLLLTPALVESLSPEELDGVVAHEAGHVRHHHLWTYLFFFFGFTPCSVVLYRLVDFGVTWSGLNVPSAPSFPYADQVVSFGVMAVLLGSLIAYLRLVFGALSRAFERQADGFALRACGRAGPLVSALERISSYSGDIRDLPSWHHGSIGERVRFLAEAANHPELLERHDRKVRRMTLGFAAALVLGSGLAMTAYGGAGTRLFDQGIAAYGLFWDSEGHGVKTWMERAYLFQSQNMEVSAERAYGEILRRAPANVEALNNLAWLYVTSRNPALYHPERALALAEVAVRLGPSPHVIDTLAEARFRTRDFEGALAAIEAALLLKPTNRDYYLGQRRKFLDGLRREKDAG